MPFARNAEQRRLSQTRLSLLMFSTCSSPTLLILLPHLTKRISLFVFDDFQRSTNPRVFSTNLCPIEICGLWTPKWMGCRFMSVPTKRTIVERRNLCFCSSFVWIAKLLIPCFPRSFALFQTKNTLGQIGRRLFFGYRLFGGLQTRWVSAVFVGKSRFESTSLLTSLYTLS